MTEKSKIVIVCVVGVVLGLVVIGFLMLLGSSSQGPGPYFPREDVYIADLDVYHNSDEVVVSFILHNDASSDATVCVEYVFGDIPEYLMANVSYDIEKGQSRMITKVFSGPGSGPWEARITSVSFH